MQPMTKKLYALVPDKNGWRTMSNGAKVWLGLRAKIGDEVKIGNRAKIGNGAKIGDGTKIGDGAKIGDGTKIGDGAKIGNRAKIGDEVEIGDGARIGNWSRIGDGANIGDRARIDDYVSDLDLNNYFIQTYPETAIFWKWVTQNLVSPGWGLAKPIQYNIGDVVIEPTAKISSKQCDIGLHVFRPGIRPEFVGLCLPIYSESLICL